MKETAIFCKNLGQISCLTEWNISIHFSIICFLRQIANIFGSTDIRVIDCKFFTGPLGIPGFQIAVIISSAISLG